MILLTSTSDKLRLVSSAAVATDVHASWVDNAAGTITPGRTNSAVTTATTTDIVAPPAASTQRNIKTLHVRNKHATLSQQVTIIHTDGTTAVELHSAELTAGQALQYVDGLGFNIVDASLATELLTAISRNIQSDLIEVTSVLEGRVSIDPTTLINGPLPEPVSQISDADGTIAEVEANTRAIRRVLRARDFGGTIDTRGFDVNRYQMSFYSKLSETTNAGSNVGMTGAMWMNTGFAVINKVTVCAVLEALSGARSAGAMNLRYRTLYPCYLLSINLSNFIANPTGGQTLNQVGRGSPNLRQSTHTNPRLFCLTGTNWSNAANLYAQLFAVRAYGDTLATVRGGPQNVLGNLDVPPVALFDASAAGMQPHIIDPDHGFIIEMDCPAAATSYTITLCTTVSWEEWVPTNSNL